MIVREFFFCETIVYLIKEYKDFSSYNENALGKYLCYKYNNSSNSQEMVEREINKFLKINILKYALSTQYQIECKELEFYKNENGKPFFKNIEEIFFNISHSENMFACAVSKKRVGIDVQKIKAVNEYVYGKVCTSEEINSIFKASDSKAEFVRFWTKKEAYIKAIGKSIFTTNLKEINIQKVYTQKFDDYFMSVCTI